MDSAMDYTGHVEYFPKGHKIFYSFRFPNFSGTLPPFMDKIFQFYCTRLPSSWGILINFQVHPSNGSVCPLIYFKRNDTNARPLLATFNMGLSSHPNTNSPEPPTPIEFTEEVMLPDWQVTHSVPGFIPRENMIEMTGKLVIVHISVYVEGCHSEEDTKRKYIAGVYGASPKPMMQFSKI